MPRSDSQLFLEKGRTHRVGSACLEQLGHAPRIGLSQQNQNRHRFEGTQRVRGVIVEGCVVCHDERPRCGIGSCEARRVIHADVPRTQRIAEPPGEVAVKGAGGDQTRALHLPTGHDDVRHVSPKLEADSSYITIAYTRRLATGLATRHILLRPAVPSGSVEESHRRIRRSSDGSPSESNADDVSRRQVTDDLDTRTPRPMAPGFIL